MGKECVEAPEPDRRRSFNPSRESSEPRICCAWPGYSGAIILRAAGFCVAPEFVEDVGLLKSTVRALCEPRAGGGSGLLRLFCNCLMSTQSGSGLGVKGLLGLFGLGKRSLDGGWTRALAGRPLENEHPCYSREEGKSTIVKPPFPPIRACRW